jgi:chloramphenicol-sensitive protein RarD
VVAAKLDGRGITAAVAAYAMWGLFPAFWPLLAPAVPIEVLAHRVGWTSVLMVGVLTVLRGWPELRTLSSRGWAMVAAAGTLITLNWGLYIYAVFNGHFVEAALGYFMSPLVSVLLGVVVLRERMGRAQWAAVALGLAAVVVIAVENGSPPWIALALAASFGIYGLIKRTVPLSATAGVTAEGLVLGPFAVAVVVWFEVAGGGTMLDHGPGHLLLLIVAGPVTALPLLLFGVAARRVPLSTIGVLMYLNPILQFSWGVFVIQEPMPATRWIGFVLIWIALVVFTVDLLRTHRRESRSERARVAVCVRASRGVSARESRCACARVAVCVRASRGVRARESRCACAGIVSPTRSH